MNSIMYLLIGSVLFLLLIRLFLKIYKNNMGGSGNVNDPVYVIRCDKTYFHGFNGMPKIGGPDVLKITLGAGLGKDLPGVVDLKIVFIDAVKNITMSTVLSAPVEQDGTIGAAFVTMSTSFYPNEKLYCRAVVTIAYPALGLPWRNANANNEIEKAIEYMRRKVKNLK